MRTGVYRNIGNFMNNGFVTYRGLFFVFVFLLPMQLQAASYTWNGGTSSDWATGSNWTPNGVPGSADNVTISGAGIQPVLDMSCLSPLISWTKFEKQFCHIKLGNHEQTETKV
jgi:hypothetical protein